MDYKEILKQEFLKRQASRAGQDSKMENLLQKNERLVNLPVEDRQDIRPITSFIDNEFCGNTTSTVRAPETTEEALRKALHARLQAPKQDALGPLKLMMDADMKERALAAKAAGGTKDMSMEKLKRLGSARMAYNALNDVEQALSKGSSVLPEFLTGPTGDNEFSEAARNFVEGFGRMQSGGAITADEDKRFARLLPRFQDDPEMRAKKLSRLKEEVRLRIQELGGDLPQGDYSQSSGDSLGGDPDSIDMSQLSDEQLAKLVGK